jgi:hypothetical protein
LSPQAIGSPDDIEQFANDLVRFNAQLRESVSRLQGEFGNLGETWRDQEHQKFATEFEQTVRVLAHFSQASEEQIPFLLRKAQRLREYLEQR